MNLVCFAAVVKVCLDSIGFNYNIRPARCVYEDEMERKFRVTGTVEDRAVIWFVNRCKEPGSYALDESFSREEAGRLDRLLKSRNLECRIEQIPGCAVALHSASWNLIGRLFRLDQSDEDQLSFPVVGCVVL